MATEQLEVRRRAKPGATHCFRGHAYTSPGQCAECQRIVHRAARERHRGATCQQAFDRALSQFSVGAANECWPWNGAINAEGYGRINWRTKVFLAHRVVYLMRVGDIPEGLTVDHLCRNTRCVNPGHMEIVTYAENARRARLARRVETCKFGHPLDGVVMTQRKDGMEPKRFCRTCNRARCNENYRRKKELGR